MTTTSPDQLRWQITPGFAVALDATEQIVAEVHGSCRTVIDETELVAEAFRQAKAQQQGAPRGRDVVTELIALRTFARQIAEMRKDGEPLLGGELFDYDSDRELDAEEMGDLIDQARDMLGIVNPYPEPDPDPCAEADLDAEPRARFRFNNHYNERGNWCPASLLAVSEKLASSDDKRCLHECPDSTIEPVPVDAVYLDAVMPEAGQ